jgi:hypothetical protein
MEPRTESAPANAVCRNPKESIGALENTTRLPMAVAGHGPTGLSLPFLDVHNDCHMLQLGCKSGISLTAEFGVRWSDGVE